MDKISVLVIDDSKEDRYLFSRDLQQTGIEIEIFEESGAEQALAFLANYDGNKKTYDDGFPPGIVFLDVNMPKMDGHQFLEKFAQIRKSMDLQACVVMMLSSSGRTEDRKKAMVYDFVKDYLIKGECSAEDLKSIIEGAVNQCEPGTSGEI